MKSILLLAALSASAFPQAAPQPATSPATPAQSPLTTLHARGRVVLVDVVVTGAHDQPVRNLKKSDFTVLEDGKPQTILAFESHLTGQAPPPAPAMPKLEPGVFTNYTPIPPGPALNILLLDALNTPLNAQPYLRTQVLAYLKTARPGVALAIFGLNGPHLTLLQGFTADPELLRNAIDKKGRAKSSPLMNNPLEGDNAGQQTNSDTLAEALGNAPGAAEAVANLAQFDAQVSALQLDMRVRYTLDALGQIARYLGTLPGRKNLIWFSGSFPLGTLPDGDLQNPFDVVSNFESQLRDTATALTHGQVAVYPVDARGLMTSPVFSASNPGSFNPRNPGKSGVDNNRWLAQTSAEHATMYQLAEQTGGKAFVNTNGLRQAVEQAIDIGNNYYTIAYTPTNTKDNGDFRKIKIQLDLPGYNLSYRRGYYALKPPAKPAGPTTPTAPNAPAPPSDPSLPLHPSMHSAMERGAPTPSQILMKVRVQPNSPVEPAVAPGNQPDPALKGPFTRYSISYAVAPGDILFNTAPDQHRRASIEFVALVYDANGQLFNASIKPIHTNFPPDAFAQMLRTGLQYQQEISVPTRGEYFLRIGIHDLLADHVGALEVPVDTVRRLTPIPAAPALPPAATPPSTHP